MLGEEKEFLQELLSWLEILSVDKRAFIQIPSHPTLFDVETLNPIYNHIVYSMEADCSRFYVIYVRIHFMFETWLGYHASDTATA